jgi:hypothetical protein
MHVYGFGFDVGVRHPVTPRRAPDERRMHAKQRREGLLSVTLRGIDQEPNSWVIDWCTAGAIFPNQNSFDYEFRFEVGKRASPHSISAATG